MELSLGLPPGMMLHSVIGYNLESRQGKNYRKSMSSPAVKTMVHICLLRNSEKAFDCHSVD